MFEQFAKYSLVGLSGVLVNGVVYFGTQSFLGASHSIAWAAGIGVAWITNFILNKFWTFKNGNTQTKA